MESGVLCVLLCMCMCVVCVWISAHVGYVCLFVCMFMCVCVCCPMTQYVPPWGPESNVPQKVGHDPRIRTEHPTHPKLQTTVIRGEDTIFYQGLKR